MEAPVRRLREGLAMIRITLPWPSRTLSPNARVHWATKARAAKSAKKQAWMITRMTVPSHDIPEGKRVSIHLVFHPPSKRRRDWDNLIASMKSSLDGMASALGIDDSLFMLSMDVGEQVHDGQVIVEITEQEGGE
jgi:crossover junction endodeoxyribonuclease RusA